MIFLKTLRLLNSFLPLLFIAHLGICIQKNTPKRKLKILLDNPSVAYSHIQFVGKLADVLVEAGHDVHVLMLNVDPNFANYTGTSKVQRIIRVDRPEHRMAIMGPRQDKKSKFTGFERNINGISEFVELQAGFCEDLVNNKDLMAQLKTENYDVGISEFYTPCSFAIFHHINVKTTVGTLAIHLFSFASAPFGIPIFSSYVPNLHWPTMNGPNMNFLQRAMNFFVDIHDTLNLREYGFTLMQPIVEKAFGSNFPSIKEITQNVSLIFTNTNEFFEFPRPVSNKVKCIGGIVQSEAKPLRKNIKDILDNSVSGVVLLSFGSIINTTKMSQQMKKSYLASFSHFPTHDFIWKLKPGDNESAMFASVPNVHLVDWFDQKAILEHTNVKAFMTHCGLNSMHEAILSAVPMIGLPFFGDQLYNAALMVNKGIGEFVPIESTNDPQVLIEALDKVLNQPKYRNNIKLLQKKLQMSPFTPEEKFVKWVEFAAEFPNLNELNLPFDELGFLAYYCLDVIFIVIILMLCISIFVVYVFKWSVLPFFSKHFVRKIKTC